ncbi:MAG: hypothetical protein J6386_09920 [Candidatus Synoicihabitans palmerolidicus]|nr:hypothetical protein [Candidatus Synoicihabitans palmerolidicus]
MHLRAPTSAIGSRKSAQKSAFLPPFQNQGKWDTLEVIINGKAVAATREGVRWLVAVPVMQSAAIAVR